MKKKIHDASLMTAIKTPYKSGGEIDLDCYDELVTEQMRNGVEGSVSYTHLTLPTSFLV